MVHALETVHDLLVPDGILIDIRPTGDPPPFEVHIDGQIFHAGWLRETDDFVEYFQARDALDETIQRGLFVLEREDTFTFYTYGSTMVELRDYLLAEWSDSIIDDETVRQAEELYAMPGRSIKAALHEMAHIARLRRG
jgi:hypothetical protein